MSFVIIGEKDFVVADQEQFATVSGDSNPIHMDALAARRTMAGSPVVHGIHTLLWGLDNLFQYLADDAPVASIHVTFPKMVYVGDHVQAVLLQRDKQHLFLNLIVENLRVMTIRVAFGDSRPRSDVTLNPPLFQPKEAIALTFEQMIGKHGRIPFFSPPEDVARLFPAVANVLGLKRVAALACSSYLVGMVCPGLHSLYRGLNLVTTFTSGIDINALDFRVISADSRFRLLKLAICGGGWTGTIGAHARPEPSAQAKFPTITSKVEPDEFSDTSALVVGGSRGLGELIAKIVAAGGGHVILTYSVGELDAYSVRSEILSNGGRCDVIRYNVLKNPDDQLSPLSTIPNQMYYLATPRIFRRRKNAVFVKEDFEDFFAFYVTGFLNTYRYLTKQSANKLSIFYPSSVSIENRPRDMTEYTMVKAAGEVLCNDLNSFQNSGPIIVRRLPRLSTDQTATLLEVNTLNSLDVLLPIVREMHKAYSLKS
jgi:MaoC like domain